MTRRGNRISSALRVSLALAMAINLVPVEAARAIAEEAMDQPVEVEEQSEETFIFDANTEAQLEQDALTGEEIAGAETDDTNINTETEIEAQEVESPAEDEPEVEQFDEIKQTGSQDDLVATPETPVEQAPLTYEDEDLIVTVTAPAGVLPEGARVEAEEIHPVDAESADVYGSALSSLSEALRDQDKVYADARVYDIRILDAMGAEIEPTGEVQVKLSYKQALPLGDAEPESVDVAHVSDDGELTMMNAAVDTNAAGEVEAAAFTTTGFSVYLLFSNNATTAGESTTEANIGDVGWLKFYTPAKGKIDGQEYDRWGTGTNPASIASGSDVAGSHASRRIFQVELYDKSNGNQLLGKTKYFWTWENTVTIDDFNFPGYAVDSTVLHTAYNDSDDAPEDSLIGSYFVRGYAPSEGDGEGQINTLKVYLTKTTHNATAMRYIIRYVHADGSVTDGSVRYLERGGSTTIDAATHAHDDEVYSGVSVVTGPKAVSVDHATGAGTISYRQDTDTAKVYVYYKDKPNTVRTFEEGRFDKDDQGRYRVSSQPNTMFTDKSIEQTTDRQALINLETWYMDYGASVGMVLDASGSMAWPAGALQPVTLTSDQIRQLNRNYYGGLPGGSSKPDDGTSGSFLSEDDVDNIILDTTKTDSTSMGYNGYSYYVYDPRTTVLEYVALGYVDSSASTPSGGYSTLSSGEKVYANRWSSTRTGWYYVNSSSSQLDPTAKSYDGLASNGGRVLFYVKNGNELWCRYFTSSSANNSANGATAVKGWTDSRVYEKRDAMFTKNETLQDAVSQFGAILLASSPDSEIAMTRFSTKNLQTGLNGGGEWNRLPLLNWTSDSRLVAGALDQTGGSTLVNARQTSAGGTGVTTYEYGLTGQTITYTGVEAFNKYLKDDAGNNNKYLIIFTDGKDTNYTGNNNTNSDADKTPEAGYSTTNNDMPLWGQTGIRTRQLQQQGYKIITVLMKSLAMNEPNSGNTGGKSDYQVARPFLEGIADTDSKGNKLYFDASSDDAHDMIEQFRKIAEYISTKQGYSIRDYIDPRFDVINDAGTVLTVLDENGDFTAGVNPSTHLREFTTPDGKIASLGYDKDKKMFYVLWQDQSIPVTNIDNTDPTKVVSTWKSQIRVQAKDDFLGGNDVLTNGNESGQNQVYRPQFDSSGNPKIDSRTGLELKDSSYPSKDFPYTTVNVATDLKVDSYEDTVYAGESISPYTLFNKLQHTWTQDEIASEVDNQYRSESYFDYLTRVGAKLHSDANYYISILQNGALPTGHQNKNGESITVSGDTITMTLPYYYLPKTGDSTSYAGGTKHQDDKVGTLTYTWRATDHAGKTSDNAFANGTAKTNENQNAQVKYDLTITYVPDSFERGNAGSTDTANVGSTRTRALTGLTGDAALIRDVIDGNDSAESQNAAGDVLGTAVIHVVDGRIALEKKVNKADLQAYLDALPKDGTVTFTYSLSSATSGASTADDIVFTLNKNTDLSTLATSGSDVILFSGEFKGTEDGTYTWTQLNKGDYTVTETISANKVFGTPTYTPKTYEGPDARTTGYTGSVASFLAKQEGTVTVHLGTVSGGTPASGSYTASFTPANDKAAPTKAEVEEHYDDVKDHAPTNTGTGKHVDPAKATGNANAYLNAQIGAVTITNTLVKVPLNIEKQDATTAAKLGGITFELKRVKIDAASGEEVEDATVLDTQTTAASTGTATFANLIEGTYHLYEKSGDANAAYSVPADPWVVVVKDGKVESVTAPAGTTAVTTTGTGANLAYVIKNDKPKPGVEVLKTDAASGDVLQGATFQLKNEDGTAVGDPRVTGEDGKARFDNLELGKTYLISETSAPVGYALPEQDIKVTVAADGAITMAQTNGHTGDAAPTLSNTATNSIYTLTVPNVRVYNLPASGGPGVYPFLLVGAFVAAYAASGASDERRRATRGKPSHQRACGSTGGD